MKIKTVVVNRLPILNLFPLSYQNNGNYFKETSIIFLSFFNQISLINDFITSVHPSPIFF